MKPLLLASTSPYRRQLLERLGLPFDTFAPEVDERPLTGESGFELAARLAAAKAERAASERPDAVVIASDQVAVLGDKLLGKPGGPAAARQQLGAASGQTVTFHTAVCVRNGKHRFSHTDQTRVIFRALSSREIDAYLAKDEPFDCAGSFKAEQLGIALFDRIDSQDPTALTGLPLIWLSAALRDQGYPLP